MVRAIPEGYRTITPYLTVSDLPRLLEFIKAAFNANVYQAMPDATGKVRHAEAQIGDSKIMMGQARAEWPERPGAMYLYVEDCDATYNAAMAAGGKSLMEPADQFYGDRNAGVEDPLGNYWWISTHVEDVEPEELARRARESAK